MSEINALRDGRFPKNPVHRFRKLGIMFFSTQKPIIM